MVIHHYHYDNDPDQFRHYWLKMGDWIRKIYVYYDIIEELVNVIDDVYTVRFPTLYGDGPALI